MPSPARARLLIAVAAFALAAFSQSALAQSGTGEAERLEPPTLLDATLADSDGAVAPPPRVASPIPIDARTAPAKPVADEAAIEPDEIKSPPVPVDGDAGKKVDAGDSDKPQTKGKPGLIDQYPQNPRCYVAGRYVAAPPTCPN